MEKFITIRNTKGIQFLRFDIPSKRGVYLLVGANGVGKTTVLVTLDKICNNMAFAKGFQSSQSNMEVDQYKEASITYTISTETKPKEVSFRKKNKRWTPSPKKGNAILKEFGYKETIFIQASAERIEKPKEEIRPGNIQAVEQPIINYLNAIFSTDKYSKLKRLKNTNGRGKSSTYFYLMQYGTKKYYSEKLFSTGELALVRLVERLNKVPHGSLILLDEAELALHPSIQVNLLAYLEEISKSKNLTIIVSTHSITMIKRVNEKNILLLDTEDKKLYNLISPCYHARAIGTVDYIGNVMPDIIFYVEDDMSELFLRNSLKYAIENGLLSSAIDFRIFPVGGFIETAKLAVRVCEQLPSSSKILAVLDADVYELDATDSNRQRLQRIIEKHKNIDKNLGCTVEVEIVKMLESNIRDINHEINQQTGTNMSTLLSMKEYTNISSTNFKNIREESKTKFNFVKEQVSKSSGQTIDVVNFIFMKIFVDYWYQQNAHIVDLKKIISCMKLKN